MDVNMVKCESVKLKLNTPVDDPLSMQVLQTTADLCCIKDGTLFIKTWVSHVIDMKLQVTAIHYSQHQT